MMLLQIGQHICFHPCFSHGDIHWIYLRTPSTHYDIDTGKIPFFY